MGAGGGGSAFVAATATNTSSALSGLGTGQVTISFDPTTDSCPPALVVAPEFTG